MNPANLTIPHRWMNKFSHDFPLDGLTNPQADKARAARAARDAARLSTGPRTDEGKAVSSKNARKHGFASAQMVLDDEDKLDYAAHLDGYHQALQPANQVEADTVRLAANAMWRIDRLTSIETGLLELEMAHHAGHIDAKMQRLSLYHYMAIGFMEQTDGSNASDLCRRYLSSAQRDFQRALDLLFLLRQNRVANTQQQQDTEPAGIIHIVNQNQRPPNELAPQAPQEPQKRAETALKAPQSPNHASTRSAKHRKNRR